MKKKQWNEVVNEEKNPDFSNFDGEVAGVSR